MSDMGSYIWFIGLGICLIALAVAVAIGRLRGRPGRKGNPNNAWEEAARDSGHPEVARPEK